MERSASSAGWSALFRSSVELIGTAVNRTHSREDTTVISNGHNSSLELRSRWEHEGLPVAASFKDENIVEEEIHLNKADVGESADIHVISVDVIATLDAKNGRYLFTSDGRAFVMPRRVKSFAIIWTEMSDEVLADVVPELEEATRSATDQQ